MKKNSRKTIAIAIVLVVAILLSIFIVVKVMQKNQKILTEEVSQIANEESERMLADATGNNENTSSSWLYGFKSRRREHS